MIVIAGGVIGALLGIRGARRHQGTPGDQAQWGAACGIAGLIAGLFATILIGALV